MRFSPSHRSRTADLSDESFTASTSEPSHAEPVGVDDGVNAAEAESPAPDGAPGVDGSGREGSVGDSPASAVAPVIVPRWVQLVVLPLALLALWALARAAGPVLLIFLIASVLATILNPVVKRFERVLPRGLAMVAVFLVGFAILTGIAALLAEPIGNQVDKVSADVPHIVHQANNDLSQLQRWFKRHGVTVHIQQQGQTALQTIQKRILKSSGSIVSYSKDLLAQLLTTGIDFLLTVVLTIYLLAYARPIGNLVRRIMPPGDGTDDDDFPLLIQRVVSGYVRGQLLFSLIMGTSAMVGLWLFGVVGIFPDGQRYALFFGAFYGLMELIPYLGPVLGAVPAVVVALFTDPVSAVWVVLLFVALQQLEGHFVAPQVFRISLGINPIIVILALLFGYQVYGIVGALLALPLAAMIRQTVVYLRHHLVLEPWAVGAPVGLGLGLTSRRCPQCGRELRAADAFCPGCGASAQAAAEHAHDHE